MNNLSVWCVIWGLIKLECENLTSIYEIKKFMKFGSLLVKSNSQQNLFNFLINEIIYLNDGNLIINIIEGSNLM
jgi:hypothetical protein